MYLYFLSQTDIYWYRLSMTETDDLVTMFVDDLKYTA